MARKKILANHIDHTLLKPDATQNDIEKLCQEAAEHQFAAVCVPPTYVRQATKLLKGKNVAVATVVGFPLGYHATALKLAETERACQDGATEIDMVINLTWVKNKSWDKVRREIKKIAKLAHRRNALLKVIIETALLSEDELIQACTVCAEAKADFVKTSTGFSGVGATVAVVTLMRKTLPESVRIKASGGIKTYEQARDLVNAGADRLGSSASLALLPSNLVNSADKATKKTTSRQTTNEEVSTTTTKNKKTKSKNASKDTETKPKPPTEV